VTKIKRPKLGVLHHVLIVIGKIQISGDFRPIKNELIPNATEIIKRKVRLPILLASPYKT
jgi:hypothetical protein